jgi:3D (Asp-Asp-Asp) domain-containing protein
MAEKKISELTAITGAELAGDDVLLIVDTSETQTKKLSKNELFQQIETEIDYYGVENQTGTTYTLDIDDHNNFLTFNNSSAVSVTIPTNSSVEFLTGTKVYICQLGSGAVTVAGDTGVTITNNRSASTAGAGDVITLMKIDDDSWVGF